MNDRTRREAVMVLEVAALGCSLAATASLAGWTALFGIWGLAAWPPMFAVLLFYALAAHQRLSGGHDVRTALQTRFARRFARQEGR